MRQSVRQRYEALARAGEIVPDEVQRELVEALDSLAASLSGERRRRAAGPIAWFRSRGEAPRPRGLYIWGDVGRGKTLLMDLFFAAAPLARKRRVHFHQFMGEAHDRIAEHRQETKTGKQTGSDPIARVARALASEIELLCFDEFAVHDIADAMILGRLFEQLFRYGVVVVATTNVPPDDLYKDGLNRALFLPFIRLLKKHMRVFHLDAPRDYRLDSAGTERRYVTPLGPPADACLAAHFRHFAGVPRGERGEIVSRGRRLVVPETIDGVARFSFAELCSRPLGAGDYGRIADAFHTLILADVPILAPTRRNEAKRLINLIDTLYDKRVRLIVSAEAEPDELLQIAEGVERLEFARTASRLVEMRSDAYWDAATANAEMKKARAMAPGPDE